MLFFASTSLCLFLNSNALRDFGAMVVQEILNHDLRSSIDDTASLGSFDSA